MTPGRAQPTDYDEQGAQILTRGPVHEAFAGMVSYDLEPGIVVTRGPPDIIEELPPEERPEGDNVAWIPGYWAWDDERDDFLWISGTWRALPPGREWMAGYWTQTAQGHQWISGYWADSRQRETTYLPPPPATIEEGPSVSAPSPDYEWMPGSWVWQRNRYAWRPGYWVEGRADWIWIPASYVRTPRGYIFVDGFWDHSIERRGVLFAPVYFQSNVYSRRGYSYSPRIAITLSAFTDNLFLRPRYRHYYFGDYYAPGYEQSGFHASFTFNSRRRGYDPVYSHQRWQHRRDSDWGRHRAESFRDRRDHESARPPHTWAEQRRLRADGAVSKEDRAQVAMPIDQLASRKDRSVRLQTVNREERQKLAGRGLEVQRSREQRRTLEARTEDRPVQRPGRAVQPTRVKPPQSPIVAPPASRLQRNQVPPAPPKPPKPDLRIQPRPAAPAQQPHVDGSNPPSEPRAVAPPREPAQRRDAAAPRNRQVRQNQQPRAAVPSAQTPEAPPPEVRKAKAKPKVAAPQPATITPPAQKKGTPARPEKAKKKEPKGNENNKNESNET